MRPWLKTFGVSISIVASSFSVCRADEGQRQMAERALSSPIKEERVAARKFLDGDRDRAAELESYAQARRIVGTSQDSQAASKLAKQIKSSPLYRDGDQKETGNWIAQAYRRLGDFGKNERDDRPTGRSEVPSIGGWLNVVVWIVLGAAVLVLGYLIFRSVDLSKRGRKALKLVDDDEPERSLDEWLALADQFIAEGKFREAIRCLYVSSLLRFDQYLVARFDRSQTNWEHYHRIAASPKMSDQVDFLTPTRRFDRIWYGMEPATQADVHLFRDCYRSISSTYGGKA